MDSPSDAPADVQDQPTDATVDAPVQAAGAESDAFEAPFNINEVPEKIRGEVERYVKQTQSAFTKKTQELAEQRKEAESAVAFIQALQSEDQREVALQQLAEAIGPEAVLSALGIEMDDPDAGSEPMDPLDELRQEVEAMKAEKQQSAQQAAEGQRIAEIDSHIESEFAALAKDHGDLSPDEIEIVTAHALASLPPDENGMPRIKEAFGKFNGLWDAKQKAWVESKQAQRVSGSGQQGTEQFDIRDSKARIARLAASMDAGSAA